MLRLAILLAVISTAPLSAQDWTSPNNLSGPVTRQIDQIPIEQADGFRRSLIKAIRQRVQSGELSRRDAIRIRVAMVSPAFREHCENLALTQIVFSGTTTDLVQYDEDGKIERASIDWDNLIGFLERLLPLILELISIFGA